MNMIKFNWVITLLDNKIIEESDQLFKLDWESAGTIKKFELIKEDSLFGVNLDTGEFYGGDLGSIIPSGVLPGLDKQLYFRRRNRAVPSANIPFTKYIFGYTYKGKEYLAELFKGNIKLMFD